MTEKILPMRNGVGAVVLNKNNQVFVGKRIDNPGKFWQMPQGGVDDGEKYFDAMKRELFEETGIKDFEVIKEIEGMTEYELPDYLLGKIWKGKYRGQRQKWFVIRFLGNDKDINLNTSKPEFIEWKWTNIDDLPSIIVDFKKKLYMNLVSKIKLIIG